MAESAEAHAYICARAAASLTCAGSECGRVSRPSAGAGTAAPDASAPQPSTSRTHRELHAVQAAPKRYRNFKHAAMHARRRDQHKYTKHTHTRRADLKKSGTERKECARAAPGAAGAEVVETQHEKWISMPVRSHCSWRGAAQRAPSIPASSPHLLGASCRKTQECSKHQRSANRHSCPRCRTFHSMRVFWLLLELHEDAPLLELFSRHF